MKCQYRVKTAQMQIMTSERMTLVKYKLNNVVGHHVTTLGNFQLANTNLKPLTYHRLPYLPTCLGLYRSGTEDWQPRPSWQRKQNHQSAVGALSMQSFADLAIVGRTRWQ